MPLGFNTNHINSSVIKSNIDSMGNSSSMPGFMINVNHYIFDGWLFFILIFILMTLLTYTFIKNGDSYLSSMMASSTICAIVSILARGLYVVVQGLQVGILTDFQLWIFPILSLVLIFINQLQD